MSVRCGDPRVDVVYKCASRKIKTVGLCLFTVWLFTEIPFALHRMGFNEDTSGLFEKPPAPFLRRSKPSIHTARVPAAPLYEYLTICSAFTLSLSTPVGVIDGFESMGFCGQLQFYTTNRSKWIFRTFY